MQKPCSALEHIEGNFRKIQKSEKNRYGPTKGRGNFYRAWNISRLLNLRKVDMQVCDIKEARDSRTCLMLPLVSLVFIAHNSKFDMPQVKDFGSEHWLLLKILMTYQQVNNNIQ